jgi:uncharacterized membrane protein
VENTIPLWSFLFHSSSVLTAYIFTDILPFLAFSPHTPLLQCQRRSEFFMKKKIATLAIFLFAIAFLSAVLLFDWNSINSYVKYNSESLHYYRGKVVQVSSERLEQDTADPDLYLGEQEIVVELLDGKQKGEEVNIDNYLTQVHNIRVYKGQRIIVCADTPENAEAYYTVFNYDRTLPLFILIAVFALAVILVGRRKGIRALLGVAFSLLTVIVFLAQAIFHGFNPIALTLLTVLLSTGVTLLLLNGFSRRTATGILSTLAGVCVTGIVFVIAAWTLHLSGYNSDTAEELLLVRDATGLSIRPLLLAGVLISALGAVMDVAVSLAAALEELVIVNPGLSRKDLLKSGLNIGKDMIGTMSNTLILAFAGTALNTMISLLAYGYQFHQLFSSDYLTIELTQGLCATLGVVLTVPIATGIASLLFIRPSTASVPPSTVR